MAKGEIAHHFATMFFKCRLLQIPENSSVCGKGLENLYINNDKK